MANSCGIDLGTTNSSIVIVEDGEPKVVRDKYNRVIVPSIVSLDGKGNLTVGHVAKSRMGQMPPPLITIKRKMGTDEKVQLGNQEHTAVEISTIILEHLKKLGEEAAQSTLDNVVVTVPAYFNFKQKQDTETAARQAGFKEVIVLQEPVAAALAYCVNAGDEPMIVLAYDLGGGTFDVTVLERTADNEINVLAFGGDPWLGGDDFDTLLAEHLRQQLKARNYAVDWNLEKLEHYAKFQKLKDQAEDAKKKLSSVPETSVVFPQVFSDEEGILVDLDQVVTRETFYDLIGDKLERSITLTRETLERSGVPVEKIAKLIMVGGSSYIPRVQERLRETLGLTPELVDPETIVAVGAAIKAAASFGHRIDGKEIALDLDYQAKTAKLKARISGRLSQRVRGWNAVLTRGDFESTVRLEGDRVRFDEVPLMEGKTNEFSLTLEDEEGEERLYADLPITHDATAANIRTPDALVAKPISVRTVSGLEIVLNAGVRLPTKVNQIFVTEDQSGNIRVPIYEGSVPIAEAELSDVPRSLPIGSEVEVELTFNQDYSVRAHARVRDTGQETHAEFEIPHVRVQTKEQVKSRLGKIAADWKRVGEAGGKGDEAAYRTLQKAIEEELAAPEPKMAKVAEDLSELESLLLPAEAQAAAQQALRPPLSEVERRLDEAEKNAQEKAAKGSFDVQQFRAHAAEVRRRACDCWERRDAAGWREAVSMLAGLESLAASSFDINQMPESEARELAVALVLLIEGEVTTKRAARELLREINLEALKFEVIRNPREAASMGMILLRKLMQAGVTTLPGGTETQQQGEFQGSGDAFILKGLLGGRGR
jgi:actin-like ATPase involved in cell morphogenesis